MPSLPGPRPSDDDWLPGDGGFRRRPQAEPEENRPQHPQQILREPEPVDPEREAQRERARQDYQAIERHIARKASARG